MTDLELGFLSFPVLLALIFLRIPIGLAMLVVGVVGNYLVRGTWTPILAQFKDLTYANFASYSLSVVPLFLLMGQFATYSGMSAALFRGAEKWLGHLKGGVAISAIGACAGFGAICGSSIATAATMGQVALPELKRQGYSGGLSTATIAAGGTLGILIPPSVVLVIYAILAEQNIAKLFVAAVIPGLLAAVGYVAVIAIYARLRPGEVGSREKASRTERLAALLEIWPVALIFLVVVGGIYLGIFTPTEAAAIGAIATGALAFAKGGLDWEKLKQAVLATASTTGMIFFIVLGATVYNIFLATTMVPQEIAAGIGASELGPWVILAAILVIYLLLGCFMDSLSMVFLTVPIFFPVAATLDYGLTPEQFGLWFGVLILIVVEVGLITPPVGMNLFIINALAKDVPISATYRSVWPFVVTDLVRTALLAAFPMITLFAVELLF